MKTRAIVLGSGLVGATIAADLVSDEGFEVTTVDRDAARLRDLAASGRIKTICTDLSDADHVRSLVADADIVLGAVPSVFGLQTLRAVIEAGKPYCDISFTPEDAMQLDALAKKQRVTAVVDCGVSPGISNMVAGHAAERFDRAESVALYVGGLPKVRHWPFDYKAPFAPSDVVEEYTRPARLVENGVEVTRPALSEPELIDFPRLGTLEAFNTDGLRSLLRTLDIPNMKEKTLRYPGHAELMRVFRETGLFDKEKIEVGGARVRPLDVTSRLLFPKWAFQPGEEEFTVFRGIIEGVQGDRRLRYTYDLYDEYDRATGTSSMARTTAFPCAIVARMMARGEIREPGVLPPEILARRDGFLNEIVRELKTRGVDLTEKVEEIH